jgi:hypothetical protein
MVGIGIKSPSTTSQLTVMRENRAILHIMELDENCVIHI